MELLPSRVQTFLICSADCQIDDRQVLGCCQQSLAFDFVTFFQFNRHRQPQAIVNTICSLKARRFHA